MTHIELVIDTNVLLSDANALKKFGQDSINIPFVVLQELDKHKISPGDVGMNARIVIKSLDALRVKGDLRVGVLNSEGVLVRILLEREDKSLSPDDQIIQSAVDLQKEGKVVKVISNDINLRVKASLFGLEADGHSGTKIQTDSSDIYTGILEMKVPGSQIDQLHSTGYLYMDECLTLNPNQFIHFIDEDSSKHTSIGRVIDDISIEKVKSIKDVFGLKPKNLEQVCALDILLDVDVPLVTIMGIAGTGKTLISLAAALDLVLNQSQYEKLIVIRPPIPMGKDIGFLPGDILEKTLAWMGPVLDSFDTLMDNNQKISFEYLINTGKIEVMTPTHIRGRSFGKSIIILDEAQSITAHEAKTIVTRLQETSKLIMTGDIRQIDNPNLSALDNGFSYIVDSFKPYDLAGHVTLTKSERGSLAALAAEIL